MTPTGGRPHHGGTAPRRADDRGSAAVELTLLTPVLLLFALLMILAGRVVSAGATADEVAHAAARAAALERQAPQAEAAARQVAEASLASEGLTCASHTLTLDHAGLSPGGFVTARLECHVGLGDLAGLDVPSTVTISGTSTVAVDTFRGEP
ncbi:pilus assembly protein [Nocardiopsis sp. EMB25]|uniref:TadE/TadG family type IV pilus assembly protein n=1 Tax=Nocardiopsis TaxID=2013 RepID=UPI00034A2CE7|nr:MULTISPECIES: TadE/TadG family type IV pilus assembly protein [Nocardiopsis]MCY9783992.1 pilus assembly protein [Nocardiopsis sp. EMB25]